MKLRNKNTGEIEEYDSFGFRKGLSNGWEGFVPKADSLTELNADWEDYISQEPLIKDEKIRKAVRAWAEACGIGDSEKLRVCQGHGCSFIHLGASDAQFSLLGVDYGIPYDDDCTIAELCGEEE